ELEETEIDDVIDISITDIDEDGTIQVKWKNPSNYNYNKVYIEYKNEAGDGNSILANAEDEKVNLKGLTPGSVYSITIRGKDIAGNLSDGITKKHKIAGSGIIEVVNTTSSNSYPGYSPINLVNKNGLTGGNPKTAMHDNNRGAYSMWHTNGNPGIDTWVEFDFGEEKIIDQMYIWNMNQMSDSNMTDRGFKNVKIQYSADKEEWN
ncbi:galactose-binding domain-containing protein, partial [Clostridium perfringens]|uniref:galactose-binding domain-containing protein n=1 Tax=Clostridium perfringens TaxID=1502 RepID=UPI002AC64736